MKTNEQFLKELEISVTDAGTLHLLRDWIEAQPLGDNAEHASMDLNLQPSCCAHDMPYTVELYSPSTGRGEARGDSIPEAAKKALKNLIEERPD